MMMMMINADHDYHDHDNHDDDDDGDNTGSNLRMQHFVPPDSRVYPEGQLPMIISNVIIMTNNDIYIMHCHIIVNYNYNYNHPVDA